MIDRIKSFEKECLDCRKEKLTIEEVTEAKELIVALENDLSDKSQAEKASLALDEQINKLKTTLFHNKCFLFIKKQEVINYNSDESVMFGKLLFMNHFFSDKGMETFYE